MSAPISVAIAYHSGYGHTARQAAAVAAGADSVPNARAVLLDVTTLDGALWDARCGRGDHLRLADLYGRHVGDVPGVR